MYYGLAQVYLYQTRRNNPLVYKGLKSDFMHIVSYFSFDLVSHFKEICLNIWHFKINIFHLLLIAIPDGLSCQHLCKVFTVILLNLTATFAYYGTYYYAQLIFGKYPYEILIVCILNTELQFKARDNHENSFNMVRQLRHLDIDIPRDYPLTIDNVIGFVKI